MRTPWLFPHLYGLFPALRLGALLTLLLPALALGAAQQRTARQRPTFDASVARVRVDVIVTYDGRFVDDLRPDEFVLFEDGDAQQILGVQLVDLLPEVTGGESGAGGGEEESALEAAAKVAGVVDAARAADVAGAVDAAGAAYATGENPTDLAAIVYVVNSLDLGCRGMSRFARRWGKMFEAVESTAIPHSVYLIDFLGYVHELAAFTRDAAVLRNAAEKVRGKSLFGSEVDPVYEQNFGGACAGTPLDTLAAERTFELLAAVTDSLADRPGRKALVWVSANISMVLPSIPARRRTDPFGYARADRVQIDFERSANSAGVSVYGVDPDLVTWHTSLGSAGSNFGPVDRILADPFVGSFSADRNYLNEVSRNTGGRAFIRWGNIPKALRQVQRDTSRFYLITYAPPDPPNDGDYHEIRVDVQRRNVDVRARDGYYDITEAQRSQRAAAGRRLLEETGPLLEAVKH